ncbi:MAG: vWA domain-containing protein [Methylococcales bacterium]
MSIGFEQAAWLGALLLAVVPLFRPLETACPYPWIDLIPEDPLSNALDRMIRAVGAATLAMIVLGLAGPHLKEHVVEKLATGAQFVLLLDRSASMNQNFTGRHMGGTSSETKGRHAQKLLAEFVARRPHDLFAVVSFSTAPIYTLALTADREAVLSALRAASLKGRGITNMAAGLAQALDIFSARSMSGSRVILLVSDGATRIDQDTRDSLRQWLYEAKVWLYWIYLRSPNGAKLSEAPKNPNEQASPEYFLHRFFQSMQIPYQAYEADNPKALEQAMLDIGKIENRPIAYFEKSFRSDLSQYCYGIALCLLGILIAVKWIEIRTLKP